MRRGVHLRVADATGAPLACRLSVCDGSGRYYTPLGQMAEFPVGRGELVGGQLAVGGELSYSIDGDCEIELPAGEPLTVRLLKGTAYVPLERLVTLGVGQIALRFALERWCDGWVEVDGRLHFADPATARLDAAAEGLHVGHLLALVHDYAAQNGKLYPTAAGLSAFSGAAPALDRGGTAIYVNSYQQHPALGRLSLLYCHRPVFPLQFGGRDATDDWSLIDWARQGRRKQGLAFWADAYSDGLAGGEALAALVLGELAGVEFAAARQGSPFLPAWYRLLDAGLRANLIGASAKADNRTPAGALRTLCPPGDERESLRRGATVVSNGPYLRFSADGVGPGGSLTLEGRPVALEATAESALPFERLEVIGNGMVIAATIAVADGPIWRATVRADVDVEGGWLAARAIGAAQRLYSRVPTVAHTSPVYLDRPKVKPAAVGLLVGQLEAVREWAESTGRYENERFRRQLLDHCAKAIERLMAAS